LDNFNPSERNMLENSSSNMSLSLKQGWGSLEVQTLSLYIDLKLSTLQIVPVVHRTEYCRVGVSTASLPRAT